MGNLSTPPLSSSIGKIIDSALLSCHIGMPARVLEYVESEQRVSVKPIIRRSVFGEDGARLAESIPAIEGVPVIFPGAGVYKLTFPITKGDIVWLLFSEGSLDKWLSTAAADIDPDDDRRNALSDAVAIPGIMPFGAPSDQTDSTAVVIAAPALKLGSKDASELVALQSEVKAIRDDLEGHTHLPGTFTNSGGNVTGVSGSHTGIPDPVGSLKVKVE